MIGFEVDRIRLEEALTRLDIIIPNRDAQTLLSNVLLTVEENLLKITASDMESTARISIPASNTQAGELIVRAKKLNQIAKEMKSEALIFKAVEKEPPSGYIDENAEETVEKYYLVSINGSEEGSTKYTMSGDYRSHFPGLTFIDQDKMTKIPSGLVYEMIHKTFYSVSQEDSRYVYNGLCLQAKDNELTIIGTDGRRLAAVKRNLDTPIQFDLDEEDPKDIVVYSKAIRELLQVLHTSDEMQIGLEQNNIFFKIGDAEISSRLLDGKFPNHEKVIPQETKIKIEINTQKILDGLKEVMVMAEQPTYQVNFQLKKGSLVMEANTIDQGSSQKVIPIDYSGEDFNICFNGSYLADILKNINTLDIRIEIEDDNKPMIIYDLKDENFLSLVMPMRN